MCRTLQTRQAPASSSTVTEMELQNMTQPETGPLTMARRNLRSANLTAIPEAQDGTGMPEPPSQTTPVQISPGGQSFYSTQSSPSASEVNDAIAIAMPTESPDMDENALLLQTSKKITYSAGGGLATGAGFSLHWKIGLGALGTTMAALIVQWSRIELARRKGEDPF
ncbi:g8368 [Coccomyxa viridis]|uniref:G8368 protein n=1 Tax=Coccomyxa viridis TaxID=1274662 RepID=A0ABP1G086_9CHLO